VSEGRSGIARTDAFDPTGFASQIAGECSDFDPLDYMQKHRLRETARFSQLAIAIAASAQAIKSACFEATDEEKERVGTFIGVGLYGLEAFEDAWKKLRHGGPRRVSPYLIPTGVANFASAQVTLEWGFKGPERMRLATRSARYNTDTSTQLWRVVPKPPSRRLASRDTYRRAPCRGATTSQSLPAVLSMQIGMDLC
jgi:3-oxoacyl-[acyl-carrier-protein] synthase II